MKLSIAEAADERPDGIALIAGDRRWTFAELARDAQTREPTTNIIGGRTAETVVQLLANFAARHPAILLHPRDDAATRTRHMTQVEHIPDNTAIVLFTSGSSASAKAVALSEAAFVASATASASNMGWREDDRWLCNLPLAHIGGLSIVTRSLLARRCVVLDTTDRFDPANTIALIDRHRVTLWSAVPTMIERILEHAPTWQPPSHLRAILLGGAAATPTLLERAAARGFPLLTSYGMTETCSQICTQPYSTRMGTQSPEQIGSGKPLPGVGLRINDHGIIEVSSPTLMDGYIGAQSPLHDGWFSTGDRGRLDEQGTLHVIGRADDTIITGGENIAPATIESALASFPGISAVCVFGVADQRWGQLIAAALVAPDLDRAALRRFLDTRFAPHTRPRKIALLSALPHGRNGKTDRAATRLRAGPHLLPI